MGLDLNRVGIIDLESSDLLANMLTYKEFPYKLRDDAKLWCVVVTNALTKESDVAVKEKITKEWLCAVLSKYDVIVGHNIHKFDLRVLWLFGVLDYHIGYLNESDKVFGRDVWLIDSIIWSRLFNPDRFGGHSLSAWGKRLSNYKDDFRQKCIDAGIITKDSPKGAEFKVYSDIMLSYCITPDMRLLGTDLLWKPADTFKVGDKILGFDEYSEKGRNGRRYKESEIEVINEDVAEVFEVRLGSGKILKVTGEHRFLVCKENHGKTAYDWVETKNLRTKTSTEKFYSKLPCLLPTYESDNSFDSGWMSGMFDGEGHLSNGTGRPQQLFIAQRPTKTLDKIERVLTKYKVKFSKRYTKKDSDCMTLGVLGGVVETYKALSLFRPERLVDKVDFNTWGRLELKESSYKDAVIDVKSVGFQKILKIQTSSRTFMCEGYPMHNCVQDTNVNVDLFIELLAEWESYPGWEQASKMEHKLADLALNRETLGFKFDKELAIKCLEDLTVKIEEIANKINPILPPKKMTKGEEKFYTPPANQLTIKNELTAHMKNFLTRIESKAEKVGDDYYFVYKNNTIKIPFDYPLETHTPATIDNFDHVKMVLIDQGWIPTEWRIRDLTKDSKKQKITLEQSIKALDKWYVDTMEGKYTTGRMRELGYKEGEHEKMYRNLRKALDEGKFSVIIPTSPSVRVGVEKELCPNLIALGEKVWFAKDFALFLTYRHRKSSIAGGDIEDMDFDVEYPNSGFLSMYREEDGRVPTPAIEIGSSTNRYRHIGICNIARASSVYGKEMRSLFGSGFGLQTGYDFNSLESRVMGHYVLKYPNGEELADAMIAEKPNDIHSVNSRKLGIPRDIVKSLTYALLYGAQVNKISKMLSVSKEEASKLYNEYWESVPALKKLKTNVELFWENNGKDYVLGIDGRKIRTRSKHSLLNTIFQSCGVIIAKYVNILSFEKLQSQGLNISPFLGEPDVCELIAYHDENQAVTKRDLIDFEIFETEEEAKEFTNNWTGEGQLSSIGHGKKFYVCTPNIISNSITASINEVEMLLKLKVPIAIEWVVGRNWYECH